MNMGCLDCSDKAKLHFKDLDELRDKAKKLAYEEKQAKAICKDEATGLFICNAQTAITDRYWIMEIVSGLQQVAP